VITSFSQRRVDVIDLQKNEVRDIDVSELIPELPDWYVNLVCEHDYDTERMFMKEDRDEMFFLFRVTGLLRKESL